MNKINLQQIIDTPDTDLNELANHLFPGHKHPRLALNRVLQGKSVLDADQISKLSAYMDIPIELLFGSTWAISTKANILTMSEENFKAELNLDTWETKVFDKNTLFHETVLHSPGIGLSEYIKLINEIISKYKNQ